MFNIQEKEKEIGLRENRHHYELCNTQLPQGPSRDQALTHRFDPVSTSFT